MGGPERVGATECWGGCGAVLSGCVWISPNHGVTDVAESGCEA